MWLYVTKSPGRYPTRVRIVMPSDRGERPKTDTLPEVGRMKSRMSRIVVVLPAPFGPSNPKTSPSVTAIERS